MKTSKRVNETIYINEIDYSTIELIKQLEQSDYWSYNGGLIFVCNSHSVNVYSINPDQDGFSEIGFYSIGDFAKDSATENEFNTSVRNYINDLMEGR